MIVGCVKSVQCVGVCGRSPIGRATGGVDDDEWHCAVCVLGLRLVVSKTAKPEYTPLLERAPQQQQVFIGMGARDRSTEWGCRCLCPGSGDVGTPLASGRPRRT